MFICMYKFIYDFKICVQDTSSSGSLILFWGVKHMHTSENKILCVLTHKHIYKKKGLKILEIII